METEPGRGGYSSTRLYNDRGAAVNGDYCTINDSSVILRFLNIIEEQSRTIARLQDELLRLIGDKHTNKIEDKQTNILNR